MKLGERSLALLKLAARPDGITLVEIARALSLNKSHAATKTRDLRRVGVLWSVRLPSLHTRHFSDEANAEAWRQKQLLKPSGHWPTTLPGTPKFKPMPAKRSAAPATPAERAVQCPNWTHDARFQLAPGEKPPALFSALPLGVYLEA
jgi:hypothetical protein